MVAHVKMLNRRESCCPSREPIANANGFNYKLSQELRRVS